MPAVSVNGHVVPAGLIMRRRLEMLDSDQVRMPYVRARVVDAGGVVVTVMGERGSFDGWDGGVASHVDVLGIVPLKHKRRQDVLLINRTFNLTCPLHN